MVTLEHFVETKRQGLNQTFLLSEVEVGKRTFYVLEQEKIPT